MAISTLKFSQFIAANLNNSSNTIVGLSGGANAITPMVNEWTIATRPSTPFDGLAGYNIDLSQWEFWDASLGVWKQFAAGSSAGTVTEINTGTGLAGGPITTVGTISFTSIAAHSLWANITGATAVPTIIPLSTFLLSANNLSDLISAAAARVNLGLEIGVNVEAWNAQLDEISAGTWPGANSITTLGTISFGTWNGVPITVPFGGTGLTSTTAYGTLIGGTTSTAHFQNAGTGTTGQFLTSQGPGAIPIWTGGSGGTVTSIATNNGLTGGTITTSGTLGLAAIANNTLLANISGGSLFPSATTVTALLDAALGSTQGNIIYRNASIWTVLAPGTTGEALISGGPAANVSWGPVAGTGTVTSLSASTGILLTPNPITSTGTIGLATIANNNILSNISGGTAAPIPNTLTAIIDSAIGSTQGDILYRNASSWVVLAPGTAGQVLQSGGASANPSWITPSTSSLTWQLVTGTTQALLVNNGYAIGGTSLDVCTLPATAAAFTIIQVLQTNTGGWKIAQNAGQQIYFGNLTTTLGTGGSLQSTAIGDMIELICITANTNWFVIGSQGNITIV